MQIDTEKAAIRCFQSSAFLAVVSTVYFWGDWIYVLIAWFSVLPVALLMGLVLGYVLGFMGATVEVPPIWTDEADIKIIEKSTALVGKFQDADIHEWVIIKRPDNGEMLTLKYNHTVDMTGYACTFTQPETGWFLLEPPGILYTEQPENSPVTQPA